MHKNGWVEFEAEEPIFAKPPLDVSEFLDFLSGKYCENDYPVVSPDNIFKFV